MTSFSPGYGVNASMVLLDPAVSPTGRGLDVYFDRATMAGDERGLSKIALGRIAAATGVSWVSSQSGRKDPLTIQNLWIYQVLGVYLAYDGTPQTIHGEKEIDYRDGSAQIGEWSRERWREETRTNPQLKNINGWSENRVLQARSHGAERAETGAMERAIRMGFGIKHTYSVAELALPFVALRVCPMVDMSDSAVRSMVAERQLAGVASLYGGAVARRELQEAPAERFTVPLRQPEPVPVRAPAAPAGQVVQDVPARPTLEIRPQAAPAPPAPRVAEREPGDEPADDEPRSQAPSPAAAGIPAGAVMIENVVAKDIPYSATHSKFGQSFTKWTVTVAGSPEMFVTVYHKWGETAMDCWKARKPVFMNAGPENKYREREILNVQDATAPGASASAAPPPRQQAPAEAPRQQLADMKL
jgi:hypothetical protein